MKKSQWTPLMKQLSHNLVNYLPRKHNYQHEIIGILYILRDDEARILYSYDLNKEVAFTSNLNKDEFHYMSIFEIYYDGWELVSKEKALSSILPPKSFEIPF